MPFPPHRPSVHRCSSLLAAGWSPRRSLTPRRLLCTLARCKQTHYFSALTHISISPPPSVPLLSTFTSCCRRKRNVYLHTRCSRSSPPSPSPTPPLCLFKKVAKRFSCASPSLFWWVRLRSGGTSQPCPFSHRRAQVVHAAVSVRKVLARGVGGGRAEETHKSSSDLCVSAALPPTATDVCH